MINRIVHVIDSLAMGGAQKLLVTFAHEAQHRSIQCEIISLSSTVDPHIESELNASGVILSPFLAGRLLDPGRLQRISHHLRQNKPDLIQTHLTYANIIGGLAGYACGIPVVGTLHSAGNDRRYSRLRKSLESWVLRSLDQQAIAVGSQTALTHGPRLGKRNIQVVDNAVDEINPLTDNEREAIRSEWLDDPDGIIIISVGRFSAVKAYDDLLRAFKIVRQANPNTFLLLVGDGRMRPEWEKLAADLNVTEAVSFLGMRDDTQKLLCASDLYASSSIIEGMPLSVMEALAAGLPVIATQVGDMPAIIHPEHGILVPPRQPDRMAGEILQLLADRHRMQEMGKHARRFAEANFSRAVWFDKLLSIYEAMQGHR
jgi:glycosyltransferase involved in cell wall biosynthesis